MNEGRLQTIYDDERPHHPKLVFLGTTYCGDSWCDGRCGLPALVIGDQKAHSSMVACGPVMQRFRVVWTGPTVEVPEPFRERLAKLWWT